MSSEDEPSHTHNQDHNDSASQCPECKQKYGISSPSESEDSENERIIIPIRKDLLAMNKNNEVDAILKNLEREVESLKQSNSEKDRMILDLKREMEHKMTHYVLHDKLSKQAEEINKLKSEINFERNSRISNKNELREDQIRTIFEQESRKNLMRRNYSESDVHLNRRKIHSTLDNYDTLRKQFMKNKELKHVQKPKEKMKQDESNFHEEYFLQNNNQAVKNYQGQKQKEFFKINEVKNTLKTLEEKVRFYENEIEWMNNFVSCFINGMQNIAFTKYKEQIIIPEWSLKKKVKTSWRYLKHLFEFLYENTS